MTERRYGRVTIEGWTSSHIDGYLTVAPATSQNERTYTFHPGVATVEYLPEPVTFKNGDAIQYTDRADSAAGQVRVYMNGHWHNPLGGRASEAYILEALASGRAVRLVPEGGQPWVAP
jgi:hypothetical protein